MGAKFTNIQPVQTSWMEKGVLSVKDLYGKIYTLNTGTSFDFKPSRLNFIHQNVFVMFNQNGLTFVLRRNKTWTLMETDSKLLLDFGFIEEMDTKVFEVDYALIGFMRVQGIVCPVALDLKSRQIAHGQLEDGISNGYDVYFEEPIDYDFNVEEDGQFCKDIAMSAAMAHKGSEPSLFIYDRTVSPLKTKFNLRKR